MQNKNQILILVAAVIVVLGAFMVWNKSANAPTEENNSPSTSEQSPSGQENVVNGGSQVPSQPPTTSGTSQSSSQQYTKDGKLIIYYTSTGFKPNSVTVPIKQVIHFINSSDRAMLVASNPHPGHDLYPALNQSSTVGKNGTYDASMTNVGSWGYHNHLYPSHGGTITVK